MRQPAKTYAYLQTFLVFFPGILVALFYAYLEVPFFYESDGKTDLGSLLIFIMGMGPLLYLFLGQYFRPIFLLEMLTSGGHRPNPRQVLSKVFEGLSFLDASRLLDKIREMYPHEMNYHEGKFLYPQYLYIAGRSLLVSALATFFLADLKTFVTFIISVLFFGFVLIVFGVLWQIKIEDEEVFHLKNLTKSQLEDAFRGRKRDN